MFVSLKKMMRRTAHSVVVVAVVVAVAVVVVVGVWVAVCASELSEMQQR